MKKVFLSLITIVYMAVSSGLAMEVHFCMGERTSTDFYANSGDTCGRCGMKEKSGGCCSAEQKFVKLSDDHKTSEAFYTHPVWFALAPSDQNFQLGYLHIYHKATFRSSTFADSGPPIYIANCVFLV